MTKPINYDFFSHNIAELSTRFYAVLLESIYLETRDENTMRHYPRGIYSFENREHRNQFVTLCNEEKDDPIAFSFNRKAVKP